MYLKCGP
jgi:hypothetical protein